MNSVRHLLTSLPPFWFPEQFHRKSK